MRRSYRVVRASPSQLEPFLNRMGEQGWRLAALTATIDLGTTDGYTVVLEKEG